MNKLQDQIEEISTFGQRHTIVAINALVANIIETISTHTSVTKEELMNWVEDGISEGS